MSLYEAETFNALRKELLELEERIAIIKQKINTIIYK